MPFQHLLAQQLSRLQDALQQECAHAISRAFEAHVGELVRLREENTTLKSRLRASEGIQDPPEIAGEECQTSEARELRCLRDINHDAEADDADNADSANE